MLRKIKHFLFENTSTKQMIIKNTFWLVLAEGMNKGSIFLITILIARILGPGQFGVMSFVTAFVGMFVILTDFGLTILMVREVSRDQSRLSEYLVNFSLLKVVLGILTFITVFIVSQFIGKSDDYVNLIFIYTLYAIINNIAEFLRALFRPSEQMQHEAYLKIINGLIFMGIVGYALYVYGTLEAIMYGFLMSAGVGLVVSGMYIIKIFFLRGTLIRSVNKQVLLLGVKSGAFLMGGMLAVSMFNYIDQIMIAYFRTEEELGYYSAAYKIVNIISLISMMFGQSYYPRIIRNKSIIFTLLKHKIVIGIVITGFLFFLSELFVRLLYGDNFGHSIILFQILCLTTVPMLLNTLFGFVFISNKHTERIYFYSVAIGLIANILLNLMLIDEFGAVGASISTVATETTLSVVFYLFFRHFYINSFPKGGDQNFKWKQE